MTGVGMIQKNLLHSQGHASAGAVDAVAFTIKLMGYQVSPLQDLDVLSATEVEGKHLNIQHVSLRISSAKLDFVEVLLGFGLPDDGGSGGGGFNSSASSRHTLLFLVFLVSSSDIECEV